MHLSDRTLADIAVLICGNGDTGIGKHFPYRASSYLTQFFKNCGLNDVHDGSTRRYWAHDVLKRLNLDPTDRIGLPSNALLRVLQELMDPVDFEDKGLDRNAALEILNKVLGRESLAAYFDNGGRCCIRNLGNGCDSASILAPSRPLSLEEKQQRQRVATFLDRASEDEFTEKVLVPLFQRLGFHRVTASGHREKMMEFGKDLWMKFQLPTGHWLYFCAQIKRDKIDAKGTSNGNVAEVLNQTKMAFDHAIFDPDANRNVLLDHLFIISAGEITRQARHWLIAKLDKEQRRQVIFMDRDEFLDHAARIELDLPSDTVATESSLSNDGVPF